MSHHQSQSPSDIEQLVADVRRPPLHSRRVQLVSERDAIHKVIRQLNANCRTEHLGVHLGVPGPSKPTRFDLEAERDLERGVSHRILITYEGAGCPEYLAYYQEWQARGSGIRLSGLPQKMSTRGARLCR